MLYSQSHKEKTVRGLTLNLKYPTSCSGSKRSTESPAISNIFEFKRLILTYRLLCYLPAIHSLWDRQNLIIILIQSLPCLWHYGEQ